VYDPKAGTTLGPGTPQTAIGSPSGRIGSSLNDWYARRKRELQRRDFALQEGEISIAEIEVAGYGCSDVTGKLTFVGIVPCRIIDTRGFGWTGVPGGTPIKSGGAGGTGPASFVPTAWHGSLFGSENFCELCTLGRLPAGESGGVGRPGYSFSPPENASWMLSSFNLEIFDVLLTTTPASIRYFDLAYGTNTNTAAPWELPCFGGREAPRKLVLGIAAIPKSVGQASVGVNWFGAGYGLVRISP
jgi:hypothetical protein